MAHQGLFMLSDALFPKMHRRYAEAECVVMNGTETIEYQLASKENKLTLQCNKVFRIYKQATLQPIGYDALAIEITIDLITFVADRLLTKQPKGCLRGAVIQAGLSSVAKKVGAF